MLWIGGIKKNLYLSGPTAAGKSSFIEQLANRLGLEVFRMPCHKDVEMLDFTGGMELTPAGTEYIPGALIMAMERGGILLIDEKDLLNPSVGAALHTVLDGKPLYVPQAKRWISPGKMFRVAATGNSAGLGDSTKLYKGVNRMNVATIRRYLHVKVDYMSQDEESALLKRLLPKLSDTARDIMLRVANMTRQAFVGGLQEVTGDEQLDVVISTDTLITWGKIVLVYEKSPAMKGKDLLAESLHPALLNCLLDRDNVNKAHAILGFLERVKGEIGKTGAP
jgi:cobaltochelatase CobS